MESEPLEGKKLTLRRNVVQKCTIPQNVHLDQLYNIVQYEHLKTIIYPHELQLLITPHSG